MADADKDQGHDAAVVPTAPPAGPQQAKEAPLAAGGRHSVSVTGILTGIHLLVVDDSTSMRLRLVRTLVAAGAAVSEAADGLDAMATLKRAGQTGTSVAAVITDLAMPKCDGQELLSRIRADPELQELPVVVQTQARERHHVVQCLRKRVAGYLLKPYTDERVMEVVLAAVGRKPATVAPPSLPTAQAITA